jgi:branched-chain amino acid transport system substrate-binding protein
MESHGKRIFFVGSDYIYPRESNRVMRNVLRQGGGEVVGEEYLPLDADAARFEKVIAKIEAANPDAIFSTVVGQSCIDFYLAYHKAFGNGSVRPIASLTTNEAEIAEIGLEASAGHITAAPYFSTIKSPANKKFLESYNQKNGTVADVTSGCEAAYCQVHMFARALEDCGELDTDALREALLGMTFQAPQGEIKIDPENSHTYLQSRIGVVDKSGAFKIKTKVKHLIKPDPYLVSPEIDDWSLQSQKIGTD